MYHRYFRWKERWVGEGTSLLSLQAFSRTVCQTRESHSSRNQLLQDPP
ncbi:hypothetical protein GBAR_LOCUS29613 [Geodia barretti]|uniref:Uncharacterized protein n=1 Tax=Geodia barretti TaxID=519541 RepID=A0AA35TUV3_GEOBA|nr:hypothetical protein GBAR_LOCUS29613 [Geodia barretti]